VKVSAAGPGEGLSCLMIRRRRSSRRPGLGAGCVEGCGHWSLGGIKPGRFSDFAVPPYNSGAAPSAGST
jgi:hypothetical protein